MFDFNSQWQTILKTSPFTETAEISDIGTVHGVFCSGTYLDKKSANFTPSTPIEKRRFQMSAKEIESGTKLKQRKLTINEKVYVILNVRGTEEGGVYTLELEEVKA